MVFIITDSDIIWLKVNYPTLTFYPEDNVLAGELAFSCRYMYHEEITDMYQILVKFNSREMLPEVYELSGKILRTSKIMSKSIRDLHQYEDGRLCLIRWDKLDYWYKNGFNIRDFMKHIQTHLYWTSYVDRYGVEPWPAERHGWPNKNIEKKYGRKNKTSL